MKVNINITKVFILIGYGVDKVLLHTDYPPTMPKVSNQELILDFQCEANTAEGYCHVNFPDIPIEVVGRDR